MVIETRRNKRDGLAFTLLELLLTVALLIALLGAVVYNFESAKRGSDLEEGARQFEALIRFTAAQAANSGKAIQFRFGADVGFDAGTNFTSTAASDRSTNSVNDIPTLDDLEDWGTKLRVVYEIDPVLQPGVFVDLPEARPFLEAIEERVRIEKVRLPERPVNQSTNELAVAVEAPSSTLVTFYPDGSSETADISLISKEREDYREMIVHLDGVTGAVRSELKALDDLVPIEWMDDENSTGKKSATAVAESSGPTTPEVTKAPTPMPEDPAFEDLNANKTTTKTNSFDDDFRE